VTRPAVLLRAESVVLLVLAVALYAENGTSWWLFLILLLAPDLAALGYLVGSTARPSSASPWSGSSTSAVTVRSATASDTRTPRRRRICNGSDACRAGSRSASADRVDFTSSHPGRGFGQVAIQVIVLNGGSSSGKTGIARCLQAILTQPWIRIGVDDLLDALPPSLMGSGAGVEFGPRGEVTVGDDFREIEAAWQSGVAAMARAGARVIIDDVFLGSGVSQERLRVHLAGLDVLWVGVRCDPEIALGREVARGDRVHGMAALQAELVHTGVDYDIEVDTSRTEALECARAIAARVV
jgi:chloramphenicol 3-O phosphotransferase